jgi:CheY-like chemotaxis protein
MVHMGRRRVLVVDDEPLIAACVQRLLETSFDVTVSTSGSEALESIAVGERFDAIFCDVMMPSVSGIDIYARLRQIAPDQAARMVFITGGAFTREAQRFLRTVPNPTIEKPFSHEALMAALERTAQTSAASSVKRGAMSS